MRRPNSLDLLEKSLPAPVRLGVGALPVQQFIEFERPRDPNQALQELAGHSAMIASAEVAGVTTPLGDTEIATNRIEFLTQAGIDKFWDEQQTNN